MDPVDQAKAMAAGADKLGAPQEFSESGSPPPSGGGGSRGSRIGSLEALRSAAKNVAALPDGRVVVTDDEGKVVARFQDRAAARTGLKQAGIELSKVNVAGNLGKGDETETTPTKGKGK